MAVTTMNPIYTSTEIARQIKMSKASWAVTNRDLVPVIKDAITKLGQNPAGDEWKNRIIIVDKEPGKIFIFFLSLLRVLPLAGQARASEIRKNPTPF